jgi:hypothetical protein
VVQQDNGELSAVPTGLKNLMGLHKKADKMSTDFTYHSIFPSEQPKSSKINLINPSLQEISANVQPPFDMPSFYLLDQLQ